MQEDRDTLRKSLRKNRQEFVLQWKKPLPLSPKLCEQLRAANCTGLYQAVGSEAGLQKISEFCALHQLPIALPRVEGRGTTMTFRHWNACDPLEAADFGFSQPLPEARLASPDIILTPMLGFDRAMNRIGQGAGHYDRYFSQNPGAFRIGIAWSVQEVDALPALPWDVPMHAVCTEKEWIMPAGNRT